MTKRFLTEVIAARLKGYVAKTPPPERTSESYFGLYLTALFRIFDISYKLFAIFPSQPPLFRPLCVMM